MNWDAIGAVGEIVGALAVVLTLGYLAVQVRQSNASNNSTAIQSFFNSMASITRSLMEQPELRSLVLSKGFGDWEALTTDEKQLMHLYWGDVATKLHMGYRLYKRGVLDHDSWITWEEFFLAAIQTRGVGQWWGMNKTIYAEDFVAVIESGMQDAENLPPPLTEILPYFGQG